MATDSYEKLFVEIEKRLARKKHADLLRVIIDSLKEGGGEEVKKEVKARLTSIKEE